MQNGNSNPSAALAVRAPLPKSPVRTNFASNGGSVTTVQTHPVGQVWQECSVKVTRPHEYPTSQAACRFVTRRTSPLKKPREVDLRATSRAHEYRTARCENSALLPPCYVCQFFFCDDFVFEEIFRGDGAFCQRFQHK